MEPRRTVRSAFPREEPGRTLNGSFAHPRTPFATVSVGNVRFAVATLEDTARWVVGIASEGRHAVNIRFANAWNVALANDDGHYGHIMNAPDSVNFPDGTPVVWYMRAGHTGAKGARRVRGPSLFRTVLEIGQEAELRHFFLGGSETTLHALEKNLRDVYGRIAIAGRYSPDFAPVTDAYIDLCIEAVIESKPDLIWVGLGTPKQDFVGTEIARRVGVPVLNVGAAFDFVAQTTREAPVLIQNSGLEWLYRLLSEPRRLGRRYVYGNWRFLQVATRHLVRVNAQERK